jgi:peroxiredoxin Q/BCP
MEREAQFESKVRPIVLTVLAIVIVVGMYLSYKQMLQLKKPLCEFVSVREQQQLSPRGSTLLHSGQNAPDFVLQAFPSGMVKLSAFRHKKNVVLAFYPKDYSDGCTREMYALSNDLDRFNNTNTVILGVSCDSLDSHRRFASDFNLRQLLLTDPQGRIAMEYGVKREGNTRARRVTFIINKEGNIQYILAGMPNDNQLLALIQNLQP